MFFINISLLCRGVNLVKLQDKFQKKKKKKGKANGWFMYASRVFDSSLLASNYGVMD